MSGSSGPCDRQVSGLAVADFPRCHSSGGPQSVVYSLASVPETAELCLPNDQNKTDASVNNQEKVEVILTKAQPAWAGDRNSAGIGRSRLVQTHTSSLIYYTYTLQGYSVCSDQVGRSETECGLVRDIKTSDQRNGEALRKKPD